MFEISIWTFVIVCPIVFFGGFVDSIAGGGGLITIPAYMIAGLPAHNVLATNKFASVFGTLTSAINYIRAGYFDIKISIVGVICALIGSFIGTNLTLILDESVLQIVIIVLLPISAVFVLSNKGLSKERKPYPLVKTLIITGIVAFIFGGYDGFYGPGTGTLIIICLNFLAHLNLNLSNGSSKIINLASNFAAMLVFLINGKTYIILGIAAAISQMLGCYIGSKLFINKGIKIIKPIMIVVLILLLIKVISDMIV